MADARLVDANTSFASFSHILDARILRALADLGFAKPTLVQSKAIPLALDNKDILARARTGSGKTAAYCIPLVQKVLTAKSVSTVFALRVPVKNTKNYLFIRQNNALERATRALVLVPTRELSEQVHNHLKSLTRYCEEEVRLANVCAGTSNNIQRYVVSKYAAMKNSHMVAALCSRTHQTL